MPGPCCLCSDTAIDEGVVPLCAKHRQDVVAGVVTLTDCIRVNDAKGKVVGYFPTQVRRIPYYAPIKTRGRHRDYWEGLLAGMLLRPSLRASLSFGLYAYLLTHVGTTIQGEGIVFHAKCPMRRVYTELGLSSKEFQRMILPLVEAGYVRLKRTKDGLCIRLRRLPIDMAEVNSLMGLDHHERWQRLSESFGRRPEP